MNEDIESLIFKPDAETREVDKTIQIKKTR
jgi:hypothetical protein